jgi:thiol-disulfide isomerase/thioredoxin
MRSSLLLLLMVITTQDALGFVSFPALRQFPPRSLVKPLSASSTSNPESSSGSSRQEFLRGFLAAATGAMTAATALNRVPRIAQATSADDVDPDKPQTVQTYLEDIDKYNLKCPEFPKNLEWVNTGPLSFQKDLRGKVVLMDFWTYCCINCMHTLPILASLEKKYADKPFQVIGVRACVGSIGVRRSIRHGQKVKENMSEGVFLQ